MGKLPNPPGTVEAVRKMVERHGVVLNDDPVDTRDRERTYPVVEVFGPTIQGEGPDAGRPCWFVRLGGCDFRCAWCDSMHAVDPARVRDAERLTADGILERLMDCGIGRNAPFGGRYVVLSGGNPALHHAGGLVDLLHANGCTVSVETQGSVWRDWLLHVDRLVVSPKPPSSGMWTVRHSEQFSRFMDRLMSRYPMGVTRGDPPALKVVVANREDYECARAWHLRYPDVPFYLSAMTDVPEDASDSRTDDDIVFRVRHRYARICEDVARDPDMADVVVLPQLHVIAWGTRQGV